MDNTTSIRRKAQKLVQKGSYAEAAAQYERLAESGRMEPYDLVVFGDLLVRKGDKSDAVERYLEAMDSYAEAGLYRNAIALGKKLQRLAPGNLQTHRKLGDLYGAEGLSSEACLHYLEFLEKTDLQDAESGDAVEDICTRLLKLSLPSFEIVDRIVAIAREVKREKTMAPGILKQADQAAEMGSPEVADHLRELAGSIDAAAGTSAPDGDGSPVILEPGTVDLEETALDMTPIPEEEPAPEEPETPAVLSLDEFDFEETVVDVDPDDPPVLELEVEDEEDPVSEPAAPVESIVGPDPRMEMGDPEPPTVDLTAFEEDDEAEDVEEIVVSDSGTVSKNGPAVSRLIEEADSLRSRGMNFLGNNDPVRAQMEFMKAAALYFEAGRSWDAAELYEQVLSADPNHLEALRGLVEIAHINGEKAKMAHWGCELGDVLLAREQYADAKIQFERVLAFDPSSNKAQARVKRLNTMVGLKEAGYGGLAPATSEVDGAKVTIRDDSPVPGQTALNLSQILEEFRSAVVDNIPADDGRSHFDLGMTYREMGLLEEAVQEFETVASDDPSHLASMEMLGECYLHLEQFEDAVRVYEGFVSEAEDGLKAAAHLRLGQAREALGQWDQAEEDYTKALELDGELTDALERLQSLDHRREQGAA